MTKRWFLLGVMFLLPLLVVGCGIPKEDYDAAVVAKEAAEAKVASLQSNLSEGQSQISSLESIVASLRNQVSSLTSDLAAAERTIAELRAAATEETVTPTPIAALSKDYSKYGFGFDYPKGFSITEIGMFDSEANDNSGIVQVGIENDEIQIFQVGWFNVTSSSWEAGGGTQTMLDSSFVGMKAEGVESIDRGELVETTKAGHEMVYQYYNLTAWGIKIYGIAAIFHCDESQRCYQIMTMNTTISAKEDVLEDFMNYLDSFVCH